MQGIFFACIVMNLFAYHGALCNNTVCTMDSFKIGSKVMVFTRTSRALSVALNTDKCLDGLTMSSHPFPEMC